MNSWISLILPKFYYILRYVEVLLSISINSTNSTSKQENKLLINLFPFIDRKSFIDISVFVVALPISLFSSSIDPDQYHLSIKYRSRSLNIYPSRLALNAQKRHLGGIRRCSRVAVALQSENNVRVAV